MRDEACTEHIDAMVFNRTTPVIPTHEHTPLISKPIFVIGCNRSGTTLLFETLSRHPSLWSLYVEAQDVWYKHYPIHSEDGDRVTECPSVLVRNELHSSLYSMAHNKECLKDRTVWKFVPRKLMQRPVVNVYKTPPIRLVEKTPANCLRIPFLARLFPDAKFIFVVRQGEDVVSSLMEGWKVWSRTEHTAWSFNKWHYIVPPGWQRWVGRQLVEICAFQWIEANTTAWADLNEHCQGRYLLVRHEDLLAKPQAEYETIRAFCELPPSKYFTAQLDSIKSRVYTTGGSAPRLGKWKDLHYTEITSIRPLLEPLNKQFYPHGGT